MAERPPARVERARRTLLRRLSGKPGFVGAGVARGPSGDYEIVVIVVEKASPVLADVPQTCEGIPVRTQVGGTPRKF